MVKLLRVMLHKCTTQLANLGNMKFCSSKLGGDCLFIRASCASSYKLPHNFILTQVVRKIVLRDIPRNEHIITFLKQQTLREVDFATFTFTLRNASALFAAALCTAFCNSSFFFLFALNRMRQLPVAHNSNTRYRFLTYLYIPGTCT